MRRLFLAVLFSLIATATAAPLKAQGAPPQAGAGQPYTIEYYYKCQWGHQQEFLTLFLKNHYPLLQENPSGRPSSRSRSSRPPTTPPRTAAGTIASPSLQELHRGHHREPRRRAPSSRSYGPTRRPISAKSSAALRSCSATGTCPSPTSRRSKRGSNTAARAAPCQKNIWNGVASLCEDNR